MIRERGKRQVTSSSIRSESASASGVMHALLGVRKRRRRAIYRTMFLAASKSCIGRFFNVK